MFNHFKIPNYIFEYNLTASEISTLAVLFSVHHKSYRKNLVRISQKTIAKHIGLKKADTVSNAVSSLIKKGLILRVQRFFKFNNKLGTYIYFLPDSAKFGRYFYVSRNIFKHDLSPVQLRMYLYICKCVQSKTQSCWNSYNDIASGLNLHRSSVIKTINELISLKLVEKTRVKKEDGSFSDNHYKIINCKAPKLRFFTKKKRLQVSHSTTVLSSITISVNFFKYLPYFYDNANDTHCQEKSESNCNTIRGSPFKRRSIYSTHLSPKRKE